MSKADLYKYHSDPRYYPGRRMSEEPHDCIGSYYDDVAKNPKSTINKKLVHKIPVKNKRTA